MPGVTAASDGVPTPQSEPDAFISHSSRDKRLFVRPLVECIADQGVLVWYDEYSMQPGDSLSASIDRGLATARHGVVIISPAFIETARQSGWTHYELRGIVANSIGSTHRRIVPVWLDVTAGDVRGWSPPMADLLAIDASGKPVEAVALELIEIIAPSKAGGLQRHRLLEVMRKKGQSTQVRPQDLIRAPIAERRVPGNVPLRTLLVTQTLADCCEPHASDFVGFLEDLARDLHHETELRLWEAIAGSYSVIRATYDLDASQKRALYLLLLAATMGQTDESAEDLLGAEVTSSALARFYSLLTMVCGEAVIGEGGLCGVLIPATAEEDDAPTTGTTSDS